MGKAGRWLRSFLTGRKEKEKGGSQLPTLPDENQSVTIAVSTPKEKRRWSFRRSAGGGKDMNSPDTTPIHGVSGKEIDQKRHVMAMAMATAAAADAAVAAAQAAVAAVRLTKASWGNSSAIEEAAAIKIQSVFRSYLARKALRALKGLVKLQALVRGHLVRKQATATIRCMKALVTAQARARAQRIKTVEEAQIISQRQSIHRQSPQRLRQSYEIDRFGEENVKIVEMDLGESKGSSKSRKSYAITQTDRMDHRFSSYNGGSKAPSKLDPYHHLSPGPSALTDISPRACSGHFEEFSFNTAQSSPQYLSATFKPDSTKTHFAVSQQEYPYSISHDYPIFPNYMANTESSRAKARSQSVPKQRPESCERQTSRRRPSLEGRNIPRGVRMQRSSSIVGSAVNGYHYPWSLKLDRSSVSLMDSECGSSSTILTNNNYCRSLAAYEVHGINY